LNEKKINSGWCVRKSRDPNRKIIESLWGLWLLAQSLALTFSAEKESVQRKLQSGDRVQQLSRSDSPADVGKVVKEVFENHILPSRVLGGVIPLSQSDSRFKMRLSAKFLELLRAHLSALVKKTFIGGWRESFKIFRVDRTEISFGCNV
jgi:hypothetical protein